MELFNRRLVVLVVGLVFLTRSGSLPIPPKEKPEEVQLYGYDCSSEESEVTTIELGDVDRCEPEDMSEVKTIEKEIQIVQHRSQIEVELFSCEIEKEIHIFWCGHYSHLSPVPQGMRTISRPIDQEECDRVISTRTLYEGKMTFKELGINATTRIAYTEVGDVDMDSDCVTGSYYIDGHEYRNVVVQVSMKVSLYKMRGIYRVAQGDLFLQGGYTCGIQANQCRHPVYGNVYWREFQTDYCHPLGVEVLYQGKANLTESEIGGEKFSIISTLVGDKTFALKLGPHSRICYHQAISTDFPRVFVIPKTDYGFYFQVAEAKALNADMATYWSTRLTTLEFHMSKQLSSLYRNLWTNMCENRRKVLQNKLYQGIQNPELFGYIYTGERGVASVIAGEVAHVMKCPRIQVQLRETGRCYMGLPVQYHDISGFLRPFSHIFTNSSEEIECNPLLASTYRITSEWISLLPHPALARTPLKLKPRMNTSYWEYIPLSRFSASGLYALRIIQQVQEMLMSPITQKVADNYVQRGLTGKDLGGRSFNMYPLFSKQDLEDIQKSFFEKTWGVFASFGQSVSGLIGIYFLIRLVKGTVSTLVNGYELRKTVGGWWAVLAAFSGALTQMIIRRVNQVVQIDAETLEADNSKDVQKEAVPSAPPKEDDGGHSGSLYPKVTDFSV